MSKNEEIWMKMIEGIDSDNKDQAMSELKAAYDFLKESDNKNLANHFKKAIDKLEKAE
jgi:hypothetical protein